MWVLKECTKCKEVKELIDFRKEISYRFGVRSSCKSCEREYYEEYCKANADRLKEYKKEHNRKYYKANKESIKEDRKANKERRTKYYKEHLSIPINRFKHRLRSSVSKSFTKKKLTKNLRTNDILGISIIDFRKHIERQFIKGMTLDNYGEWHLDHIIPINSATTEEEVIKLNHYSNFQPLWAKENISKYDTVYPVTNIHFKETFGD